MPRFRTRIFLPFATFAAAATAQGTDLLLTFRYPELTLSGSSGTVLQTLQPNEVALFGGGPCPGVSAEKFAPRTCFHTMAGDENTGGVYWNPTLFGEIDALCAALLTPSAFNANARSMFWSPSQPMGTNISLLPLRPGDVGRIHNAPDGQVEYFITQEQINQSLGLPLTNVLDIDAIAYRIGTGVFFSLDADVLANTQCGGPTFIQDGALVGIPDWAITWTTDGRVQFLAPGVTASVVYTEAMMDAMVVAANITDRFGVCITSAVDLESIEIDPAGSATASFPCPGTVFFAPDFLFATETMTGASLLTTVGGGSVYNGPCGGTARTCGGGPTFGPQLGIQPASSTQGAASWVNGLALVAACRHVLEPQVHNLNYGGAGGPGTSIDAYSPFAFNVCWVELVPPTVPTSVTVAPFFSQWCFPDYYFPSLFVWTFYPAGFSTFPTMAIPPSFTGKVLFQGMGFGGSGFELSTPCVIDT